MNAEDSRRVWCRLPASTSVAASYDRPFTLTIISQLEARADTMKDHQTANSKQ